MLGQHDLIVMDTVETKTLSHPLAVGLLNHWQEALSQGRLLRREDIPCRALARQLPFLLLYQPLENGADWLYRVAGTALRARFGVDLTGRRLSDVVIPEQVRDRSAIWNGLLRERRFHLRKGRVDSAEHEHIEIEIVHLPIEGSRGEGWILVGLFFDGSEMYDGRQGALRAK
ncbi:MAG: PAS domain-containing protein [Alphaproteobacteria bacterium]|nr:PAS domain-containing protein [Alphaproteobacteria bacterium]